MTNWKVIFHHVSNPAIYTEKMSTADRMFFIRLPKCRYSLLDPFLKGALHSYKIALEDLNIIVRTWLVNLETSFAPSRRGRVMSHASFSNAKILWKHCSKILIWVTSRQVQELFCFELRCNELGNVIVTKFFI